MVSLLPLLLFLSYLVKHFQRGGGRTNCDDREVWSVVYECRSLLSCARTRNI